MSPSPEASDLIKRWEGCKLTAYQDVAGIWTVGYGSTGPNITRGLTILQFEADAWLHNTLEHCGQAINHLVKVKLKQSQFDALCALVYNIGAGAFQHSTLLNLVNTEQWDKAADEWVKWDHARGVAVPGLLYRRRDERRLFLS